MSRKGRGQGTSSRAVGYSATVEPRDEQRVERLLKAAQASGTVTRWDIGRNGDVWWDGAPGKAMRTLRDAIGGKRGGS